MKLIKNTDIFKNIDTEEKAYFLGLLMADGSIAWGKNKNGIKLYGIKMGLCDIDIMDKFKSFLGIDKNFPYYILNQEKCQPVYYLNITCHEMAENLSKHGMIPNKIYRTCIPKIEQSLIRHFIRGYFDGDGCIYVRDRILKNGDKKNHKFVSITSCSEKILKQIEEIAKGLKLIRENKNHVKYPKIYKNKKHPPFLGLNHKKDIANFLNFIYENSTVYMERKFKLYLSIKED